MITGVGQQQAGFAVTRGISRAGHNIVGGDPLPSPPLLRGGHLPLGMQQQPAPIAANHPVPMDIAPPYGMVLAPGPPVLLTRSVQGVTNAFNSLIGVTQQGLLQGPPPLLGMAPGAMQIPGAIPSLYNLLPGPPVLLTRSIQSVKNAVKSLFRGAELGIPPLLGEAGPMAQNATVVPLPQTFGYGVSNVQNAITGLFGYGAPASVNNTATWELWGSKGLLFYDPKYGKISKFPSLSSDGHRFWKAVWVKYNVNKQAYSNASLQGAFTEILLKWETWVDREAANPGEIADLLYEHSQWSNGNRDAYFAAIKKILERQYKIRDLNNVFAPQQPPNYPAPPIPSLSVLPPTLAAAAGYGGPPSLSVLPPTLAAAAASAGGPAGPPTVLSSAILDGGTNNNNNNNNRRERVSDSFPQRASQIGQKRKSERQYNGRSKYRPNDAEPGLMEYLQSFFPAGPVVIDKEQEERNAAIYNRMKINKRHNDILDARYTRKEERRRRKWEAYMADRPIAENDFGIYSVGGLRRGLKHGFKVGDSYGKRQAFAQFKPPGRAVPPARPALPNRPDSPAPAGYGAGPPAVMARAIMRGEDPVDALFGEEEEEEDEDLE